ncbi:MAG: zinc ABC transporter substrate-binding protein [Alphaproteobacteria bacterium]|nr:MAG: zinc ABC transporter substrate-binding protein [Alphaproteobacteria bacterium]
MRNIFLSVFILVSSLFSSQTVEPKKALHVLTSFTIVADWVRAIGGDCVVVDSIVGFDEDPHVFTPTPATIKKLMASDIVFFNGLGLEGWWPRLLKASKYPGLVVMLAEKMQIHLHPHGNSCSCGHHDPHDPHLWHTVPNARKYVKAITNALVNKLPQYAMDFHARERAYLQKLDSLEDYILRKIAEVPQHKRVVITAHDAFSYLAHWLHLTIKAPSGLSTDSEPSSKDVAALVDLIRKDNIRALFLENMTNPRIMKQLARETHVEIVGELCSDALSQKYAPTYLAMMRHNIDVMVKAMKKNG